MNDQEYIILKQHVESCPHCSRLAESMFIQMEEHKKIMDSLA